LRIKEVGMMEKHKSGHNLNLFCLFEIVKRLFGLHTWQNFTLTNNYLSNKMWTVFSKRYTYTDGSCQLWRKLKENHFEIGSRIVCDYILQTRLLYDLSTSCNFKRNLYLVFWKRFGSAVSNAPFRITSI